MEQNLGLSLINGADPSHSTNSPIIDIVLVHGLSGDPRKTWTTPESGIYWPRDLLPGDIPNTRILSCGYDSSLSRFTSEKSVSAAAESLLEELTEQRASGQQVNVSYSPIFTSC
jgi:hypothetical protein